MVKNLVVNFTVFVLSLVVVSKREFNSFIDKADRVVETPYRGILQQMEVVGNVEAIAARKLSKEFSRNPLS